MGVGVSRLFAFVTASIRSLVQLFYQTEESRCGQGVCVSALQY